MAEWTQSDIALLKSSYFNTPMCELRIQLKRSANSIRAEAFRLGMTSKSSRRQSIYANKNLTQAQWFDRYAPGLTEEDCWLQLPEKYHLTKSEFEKIYRAWRKDYMEYGYRVCDNEDWSVID